MRQINYEMVLLNDGITNGSVLIVKRGAKRVTLEHIQGDHMNVFKIDNDSLYDDSLENIVSLFVRSGYTSNDLIRFIRRVNWCLWREERHEERIENGVSTFIKTSCKVLPTEHNSIGIIER